VAHGEAVIRHNLIDGNRADDRGSTDDNGVTLTGQGGGVDFQTDTAGVSFTNNIVTNNAAGSHGGGVAAIGYYEAGAVAEPDILHNVIAFNTAGGSGYGDGLCVWGISAPKLSGNIVIGNGGTGIYVHDADDSVAYNLSWGHTEDWAGALVDLDGLHGNLSEDPDFVDASDDGDGTNDDMRLDSGSPAIDAADPATSDPDGSTADMGAYGGPNGSW
jgi:parallel beta-helix repeat protein